VGANSALVDGYALQTGKRFRTLWLSEPYHDLALMASGKVPERDVRAVASAFIGMHRDPMGKAILVLLGLVVAVVVTSAATRVLGWDQVATLGDLGIAVSRASDVAREAADLILLRSDIDAIPEALGLAQATLRTIRQNLFWAFFYNAAAIPLAALGFLSPMLCALAMGCSDLVVIGNALRLRRYGR